TKNFFLMMVIFLVAGMNLFSAGLLKPLNGSQNDVILKSHIVNVVINNGFAKTEVDQVFYNQSSNNLEAIYTFPIPKKGSLSEVSLWIAGQEMIGEVVEKETARKLYEDQQAQGNDTALAEQNETKTFELNVYPVRANAETRVRLVYYQPIEIDLNIGRYVYQIAEGNVDEEQLAFWSVDDVVHQYFKFHLQLKSAFPVEDVRLPHFQNQATILHTNSNSDQKQGSVYEITLENTESKFSLSKDIVLYYRLADDVPARVEIIPYKNSKQEEGTFMAVVTPGASLQPITTGSDWTFVLDKSGSMAGEKIDTLANGVVQVINKLNPADRVRIITFNDSAQDISGGFVPATAENVQKLVAVLDQVEADGGTNVYDGLEKAYKGMDADRTSSILLVTDGETNTGITEYSEFIKLLKKQDIRLFSFIIGNSANEPLLNRMALESGGFAMNASSNDDLIGRILQAKAKVLYQCIYDAKLKFHGERVAQVTPDRVVNLYMGQQLVIFGKYKGSGDIRIDFTGKAGGENKVWTGTAHLPEVDQNNPEIERLWAYSAIEDTMEQIREKGETDGLKKNIMDIATHYSLVTNYTSMLVLNDQEWEELGIERKNKKRVEKERKAQQLKTTQPIQNYQIDQDKPESESMFKGLKAPNIGSSPVGPFFVLISGWLIRRRKKKITNKQ
ncbi:MAG: VIT and VWA domain-containing protein, partial [Spirochaetes bacterium]|nr:VIT and VWA domain-containing protein [Spirochaetota bacterium]